MRLCEVKQVILTRQGICLERNYKVEQSSNSQGGLSHARIVLFYESSNKRGMIWMEGKSSLHGTFIKW